MNLFAKRPRDFKPTLVLPSAPRPITGNSFLGSVFGGGAKGGDEEPNTLRSHQTGRVVDLLSEGPSVGPWNGVKSIYYDGVRLKDDDGTNNFDNYTISGVSGYPNQPVLKGFAKQQQEVGVSVQLKHGMPV